MTPQPQQHCDHECVCMGYCNCHAALIDEPCPKPDCDYDTRSRPAPSPRIDVSKCFEDIIYSSSPWKIYRQDAGMGEHDYAVFLDDVFYCRTEDSQTAMRIVNTMRRTEGGEH